jgi:penicillin-binding protein 1A
MKQARRWSDRWRMLKQEGLSDREIEATFDKPSRMTVFTWNGRGHIDTTMTPNDSEHDFSFEGRVPDL